MKFISAKCPNCGAELQVAENLKSGFCNHCGSKILFEPEVSNVKIDQKKSLSNYKELAESAMRSNDTEKMLKYADMALEIDAHDSDVWLIKMKASIRKGKDDASILECSSNALRYAKDVNKNKNEVNNLLLDLAISRLDGFNTKPYTYVGEKEMKIAMSVFKSILPIANAADVKSLLGDPPLHQKKELLANKWKEKAMSLGCYRYQGEIPLFFKDGYLSLTSRPQEEAETIWNDQSRAKAEMEIKNEERKAKEAQEELQRFLEADEREKAIQNDKTNQGCLILFGIIIICLIIYCLIL